MNKKDVKKQFGKTLKKLRLERGMSQEELALKLGYKGRSAINKIETGVNDMPRETVVKCAQVLGVSPLVFFEEQKPKLSPIEAALQHFSRKTAMLKDIGADVAFYNSDEFQAAFENYEPLDDEDMQELENTATYVQEPFPPEWETYEKQEENNPYVKLLEEFSGLSDSAREQVLNYIKFLKSQEDNK